ncbi:DNA polymerase III subunit delta' [Candidatus Avelusimicrobium fimicolum]|jgi:DNA polymerase-3 subunit delta'|uniref:DNA polymerase III subunit delta' n=1 Tax=Candidatus Avelusimicrobium fimicolum TaxID=3416216 RepID=UPI003D0D6A5C
MPFADILGQEKASSYLKQLVRNQKVPGALLFFGPDGVGKRLAALEFAKALNCLDEDARRRGDACGACANCRAIDKATHPDVTFVDFTYQARLEVKKDFTSKGYAEELEKEITKQQHISVDTIRDVTAKSQQKAVGNGWKVLIIDQAQTMQGAAANALLKFIEEPPHKTVWVLITNKRAAMLRTILSRCQPLAFSPLSLENVKEILTRTQANVTNADLCARYSAGSVSGAVKAAGALDLLEAGGFGSPQGPSGVAAGLSRTLVTARQEAQAVLDVLIMALHRAWIDEADENKQCVYQTMLKRFENYKRSIGRNVSPALVLETALMSLDGLNLQIF